MIVYKRNTIKALRQGRQEREKPTEEYDEKQMCKRQKTKDKNWNILQQTHCASI